MATPPGSEPGGSFGLRPCAGRWCSAQHGADRNQQPRHAARHPAALCARMKSAMPVDVVEREHRQAVPFRQHGPRRSRARWDPARQRLVAERGGAAHLDLGNCGALVALDDDEIARIEPGQHLCQLRLRPAVKLGDHGPAFARHHRHLRGAGAPMPCTVRLRLVDLERMVGMLDGRDLQAAPRQLRDQPRDQCRLAGLLPAGDADHGYAGSACLHGEEVLRSMARNSPSSCGVLAL